MTFIVFKATSTPTGNWLGALRQSGDKKR